jgi:hypothetical protein
MVNAPANFRAITVLRDQPNVVIAVGKAGMIATSRDGGKHWFVANRTDNDLLTVIQLPRTRQVWAAGDNGTLLISDDDGETWNSATSGTGNSITALRYRLNGDKVYAFGDYAFQILTPYWERSAVGNINVTHTLMGLRASLELPRLPASAQPGFDIRAVRVRERDFANRIQIPVKVAPPPTHSHQWNLDFDLGNLNPHPGEAFDLEACVTQNKYVRCIPLPEISAVPWVDYQKHKTMIATVGSLAGFGAGLTILLFTYPLAILAIYRRAFVYEAVAKSGIPGADLIKIVLSGTLVPFFVFQQRTLQAWTLKHRRGFRTRWDNDLRKSALVREDSRYVSLPVETDNDVIDQPNASLLLPMFNQDALVEIVGPGGIGKTTLLKQIAAWMFDNRPTRGNSRFSIPVFVEAHQDDLAQYLGHKLKAICGEDITPDFAREILKRGVIVLYVDGLSELDPKFRDKLTKEIEQIPVANILITSREVFQFGAALVKTLRPKPLDSKTLLEFVIRLLADLPDELTDRNTMELQYDLSIRIARLLPTGLNAAPLTPLLVRLIVGRAVALLEQGRTFDELPASIAEAYFDYVLQLVRTAEVPDRILALAVVKQLAKASTDTRFVPGPFNLQRALDAIKSGTDEHRLVAAERLIASGLLVKENVGLQVISQFVLDPIAEFCSAYAYAEECGHDLVLWRELRNKVKGAGDSATGFRSALVAVVRAYSTKGLCTEAALPLLTTD